MESRSDSVIIVKSIIIIVTCSHANSIERPNHNLSYSIGTDFCLEEADSLLPNITLECSLANEPVPPPEFNFTIERTLLNSSSTEMLWMQMSTESILKLNETALRSPFSAGTVSITILCVVHNIFGSCHSATSITNCGMYGILTFKLSSF